METRTRSTGSSSSGRSRFLSSAWAEPAAEISEPRFRAEAVYRRRRPGGGRRRSERGALQSRSRPRLHPAAGPSRLRGALVPGARGAGAVALDQPVAAAAVKADRRERRASVVAALDLAVGPAPEGILLGGHEGSMNTVAAPTERARSPPAGPNHRSPGGCLRVPFGMRGGRRAPARSRPARRARCSRAGGITRRDRKQGADAPPSRRRRPGRAAAPAVTRAGGGRRASSVPAKGGSVTAGSRSCPGRLDVALDRRRVVRVPPASRKRRSAHAQLGHLRLRAFPGEQSQAPRSRRRSRSERPWREGRRARAGRWSPRAHTTAADD